LLAPTSALSSRLTAVCFSLSLLSAALYSVLAVRPAFSESYVVQEDARQHVFWMRRFQDPELFQGDILADYFQAVAPTGYSAFYRLFATVGIDPLLLSKALPVALAVLLAAYAFKTSLLIFPVPAAALVATLLLNQSIWFEDDLISATPRAFFAPLFLAFLYYLLRRAWLPCLGAISLQALFYPPAALISAAVLILWPWEPERGLRRFSGCRGTYIWCLSGACAALLVLLWQANVPAQFGPVVSAAEARLLPDFSPGGRTPFFRQSPWIFWITGSRSGIVPEPLVPPLLWTGVTLPLFLYSRGNFPLAAHVAAGVRPLPQIVLASFGAFLLAHLTLFKLYYPSRYTGYTLRIVMALAAGIALTILVEAAFRWATGGEGRLQPARRALAAAAVAILALLLVGYPTFAAATGDQFPVTRFAHGRHRELYEFFGQQPKDILIASLADEAENLPTFAKRSILVGEEYFLPLHAGYYRQLRARASDLIQAQYAEDAATLTAAIEKYGVDFWLLHRSAFTPAHVAGNRWIRQFEPAATDALATLRRGGVPVLARLADTCATLRVDSYLTLSAECILQQAAARR
jgi:hypothetical protein